MFTVREYGKDGGAETPLLSIALQSAIDWHRNTGKATMVLHDGKAWFKVWNHKRTGVEFWWTSRECEEACRVDYHAMQRGAA